MQIETSSTTRQIHHNTNKDTLRMISKMLNIYVRRLFKSFMSSWEDIYGEVGNWCQKLRCWLIQKTNKGWCGVSQDQSIGWGVRGNTLPIREKERVYESSEKKTIFVCIRGREICDSQNKGSKTLGGDYKTTFVMPFWRTVVWILSMLLI